MLGSEYTEAVHLYGGSNVLEIETKNTSRGEADYRITLFVRWPGRRIVIKLTDNDFTTPERVEGWAKTAAEYHRAGYYCPQMLRNLDGDYSKTISFNGRKVLVYGEEFAEYRTADQFEPSEIKRDGEYIFLDDVIRSIGLIGSRHLQTVNFPSGMCIFEKFCPSDICVEVMEHSLDFKRAAESFSPEQKSKFEKIWAKFMANRNALEKKYPQLPTSVFQADLNETNVLLDGEGQFKGLLDFNLSGRDSVLNYLFRQLMMLCRFGRKELLYSSIENDKAIESFLSKLTVAAQTYSFSETEKEAAILLYRYLRPFWWRPAQEIAEVADDPQKVMRILNWVENELTRTDIAFSDYMMK